MITKLLMGALVSLLLILGGLSWWLKESLKDNGALDEQVARLGDSLSQAAATNQDLARQIKLLENRNRILMVKIDATESAKASLRKQLERKNNVLTSVMRDQQAWADAPVPGSVAVVVNDILQRLSLGKNQNGDGDSN